MYHRIADEPFDPWALAVTPAHFREHLAWIAQHRTALSLHELVERQQQGRLPDNAVALTFDDGYGCNADVAAPLLEEFRIPATIFLAASLIERGRPFWWDELEELVFAAEKTSLRLGATDLAIGEQDPRDRRWRPMRRPSTPRQSAFQQLHALLVTRQPADIELLMDELRSQSKPVRPRAAAKRPMSPEQVRRTSSSLVQFGSHTLSHAWLPSLDRDGQEREIVASVDKCRDLTGSAPVTFAYPFGAYDHRSAELAKQAGFICACATEEAQVDESTNLFALPRVHVGDSRAAQLARRIMLV